MSRRLVSFVVFLLLSIPSTALSQIQLATIDGVVTAEDRPVAGATVTLLDRRGNTVRTTTSSADGRFRIADVQAGSYAIRAEVPPLRGELRTLEVGPAVPVTVALPMSAAGADQIVVRAAATTESATSTRVTLGGDSLRDVPARIRSRGLQDVLVTVPGWSSEDNGLVHVRGVDEGVLYVVDGVPAYERFDGLFGVAPDPMTLESITVSTGYIPPEFGFRSGAVVELRSAASSAGSWAGTMETGVGSEKTADAAALAAGPIARTATIAFNVAGQRSARFLDPVHPDNLHNDGHALSGGGEFAWQATSRDVLRAVAGVSGADFDVTNDAEQEEAGQDQRQRARGSWQTLSWQRGWSGVTLSQVAAYHRTSGSTLDGSAADTPLAVAADRDVRRFGVLASASHNRAGHLLKVGVEATRLHLREQFAFAVTDPDGGDFTPEVLAFTPEHPFAFADRARPSLVALFAQDSFRPADRVTVDLGVRFDWSRMPVSASQWSPRLGIAYNLERTGSTFRASLSRLFQPPQSENLLLASSEQAYALSPFVTEEGHGGAALRPERQTALEIALGQMVGTILRVDVAYWRRWVRNAADPNVLLGTTVIFPNAVDRGWASGIDVRVDLPRRRGWSAFASYGNSRVEQAGPITGGLFLEDEVVEVAGGERFTPDHDQRNVGSAGVSFVAGGTSVALNARYESGTPTEVDDDDDVEDRAGAELVDFDRGRVKPRKTLDLAISQRIARTGKARVDVRLSVLNLTAARWAYNFGNPFSGTHFGPGRTVQAGVRATFG